MKTKTLAVAMLCLLSGSLSAEMLNTFCQVQPGVALTYPDMTLYSQKTIEYHNDRVADSKLGTLAHNVGVKTQTIGGTLEECFNGAVFTSKRLPYSEELSRSDLLYSRVLPFSGQAMAFTFAYWEFRDETGVYKGMVNRNTEYLVQGVTVGDQRFRDDGQRLINTKN